MKTQVRQHILGLGRLAVGLGIIAFLLYRIHTGTIAVTFRTAPEAVRAKAVYVAWPGGANRFIVTRDSAGTGTLVTRLAAKTEVPIPETGELRLASGDGPPALRWTSRTASPCGLPMLGESFRAAGTHWPLLLAACFCFFLCLVISVVRWQWILNAQGLLLPWRKAASIVFIGQFFNSFMFGATGGDVVKAYYAAKETGHRKTEAVSTVFIDRIVGLIGLILLASATMAARLEFFMADARTRYAVLFMGSLLGATAVGLVAMFSARRLLDWMPFLRRVANSRPGAIFARAYGAFYLVLTRPRLLARTVAVSAANHAILVVMLFCVGRALLVSIPFRDFLSLSPTINAIGAIPITPGGLGLRESAMVVYMDIVDVPATQALPLSLISYAMTLVWSVVGGLVFMLYRGGSSEGLSAELKHAAESDDAAP